MNPYEPSVGEWVRVITWSEDPPFTTSVRRVHLGLVKEIHDDRSRGHVVWYRVWFPPCEVGKAYSVGYESYSLWSLSVLEKLAIAADEAYSGGMT